MVVVLALERYLRRSDAIRGNQMGTLATLREHIGKYGHLLLNVAVDVGVTDSVLSHRIGNVQYGVTGFCQVRGPC